MVMTTHMKWSIRPDCEPLVQIIGLIVNYCFKSIITFISVYRALVQDWVAVPVEKPTLVPVS